MLWKILISAEIEIAPNANGIHLILIIKIISEVRLGNFIVNEDIFSFENAQTRSE